MGEGCHKCKSNGFSLFVLEKQWVQTLPDTRIVGSAEDILSSSYVTVYFVCLWFKHTHTHIRTHARTHARTRAHTQARTYARTHAHTHARTRTRTHARTRSHAHTHTHAHTLARVSPLTKETCLFLIETGLFSEC